MEVIIGIGVPGCGKTTLLKPLAEKLGYEYVNADDIRQEITGDPTNHSCEAAVWGLAHQRIRHALANHQGVVVDATYTKATDRKKLIRFSRENGATTIGAYWFDVDINTCLARNQARQRIVPKEAIERMHQRLQSNPPNLTEGFDYIHRIAN